MKLPFRRNSSRHDGDPMTPMIDVVFLLLVFFICASVGSVVDDVLPAELAGTSDVPLEEAKPSSDRWDLPKIRVRLQPGPQGVQILLEQRVIGNVELLTEELARLSAAAPETTLILDIHDEVEVQDFISVYDLCQNLEFGSISFAVRQNAESR